jgi:hypothetical protein
MPQASSVRHNAGAQLLSRATLDGRTNAATTFDRLVADIQADLGGRAALSAIEVALIEGFAGAAVTLDGLNAQLLLGQPVKQLDLALVQRRGKSIGVTTG